MVVERLLELGRQIKNFWDGLNLRQKIALGSTSIIFIFLFIILIILTTKHTYSPLFSNLQPEDAGAIVEKLKDMKIPYRLVDNGRTILVPEENVYEVRLELASAGLPQGGGVGFEIFDKMSLHITDFTQRVNYLRALQGELSRTISQLEQVELARVHLVIPQERLYTEVQQEPTASVVVKLKPYTKLEEGQIRGIVHLVSRAVEGLKPENIEVIDFKGNVLSDILEADKTSGKITVTQMEAQRNYERNLERRIQTMLNKVLGPNKAVVRVNAELDFSKKDVKSEVYQPVVDKEGIVRSEQRIDEEFKGTGTMPGGVPGVTSNVPGYPGASMGESEYQRRESTVNYEISKIVTEHIAAPGAVKRLSIAVLVDSKGLTKKQIQDIENVASAAAGLDKDRGDQVAVESMPFSTEVEEKMRAEEARILRKQIVLVAAGTFLSIMMLLLVYFALRPKKPKVEEFIPQEAIPIERLEKEMPHLEEVGIPVTEEKVPTEVRVPTPEEISEEEREKERKRQILKDIEKLLKEKPQDVAQLLRGWMLEEV